jgi:hypothetical protein
LLLVVVVVAAEGVAACNRTTEWVTIDPHRADVEDAVASEAKLAYARGKVPLLYLGTPYTLASARLVAMRDDEAMRDAFRDVVVIEVDGATAYEALATGYWHSFHAMDRAGHVSGASLDPGTKEGPCADGDPIACAAWIRPFVRSLPR